MAGTMMKPPPMPMMALSAPTTKPMHDGRDDADIEPRLAEAHLEGQRLDPAAIDGPAADGDAAAIGLSVARLSRSMMTPMLPSIST